MSRTIPLALLILGLAAPVRAIEPGIETSTIRVRGTADPSAGAQRHLKQRLADAALEACGAAPGSLVEVKDAVRRTRCWQDSYTRALSQTGRHEP
jgi:UrcA family protein